MTALLQRLFGRRKPQHDVASSARVEESHVGLTSLRLTLAPTQKVICLYAFVDWTDPFSPGELAGEDLPGPILSIMSARQIGRLHLFHTPHTGKNAAATQDEVLRRYPQCKVLLWEVPISDPKDYSSLMGPMSRYLRYSIKRAPGEENYVCVSSGTAEMRAIWFLLTAVGVLRAKLLQVGTPAQPLFGEANVKEVHVDMSDWPNLRNLVMPASYFGGSSSAPPVPASQPARSSVGTSRSSPADQQPQAAAESTSSVEAVSKKSVDDLSLIAAPHVPSLPRTPAKSATTGSFPAPGSMHWTGASVGATPAPMHGLDEALQELGIYVGSAILRHAAEQAGIAAESDLPILLLGETGTGKERFAHLIHKLSPRNNKELIPINCAAIPESIAESYLFGHTKGAFSGAVADKPGVFEHADGSTLFLDEVGELTLDVQAKLLRVIQDGVVQRVGSVTPRKLDVRIIAATNRELAKEVSAGRFRQDLYFRLEVVHIQLPPLRERRHEIPELTLALLKQINQRRRIPRQLSKEALQRLESYPWPGNVRQLTNVLERSVLFARTDVIAADDLIIVSEYTGKDPFAYLPEPSEGFFMEGYLAQVRKQLFLRALAVCNGNQAEAAALLGITKQAVSKFLAGQADNAS